MRSRPAAWETGPSLWRLSRDSGVRYCFPGCSSWPLRSVRMMRGMTHSPDRFGNGGLRDVSRRANWLSKTTRALDATLQDGEQRSSRVTELRLISLSGPRFQARSQPVETINRLLIWSHQVFRLGPVGPAPNRRPPSGRGGLEWRRYHAPSGLCNSAFF